MRLRATTIFWPIHAPNGRTSPNMQETKFVLQDPSWRCSWRCVRTWAAHPRFAPGPCRQTWVCRGLAAFTVPAMARSSILPGGYSRTYPHRPIWKSPRTTSHPMQLCSSASIPAPDPTAPRETICKVPYRTDVALPCEHSRGCQRRKVGMCLSHRGRRLKARRPANGRATCAHGIGNFAFMHF